MRNTGLEYSRVENIIFNLQIGKFKVRNNTFSFAVCIDIKAVMNKIKGVKKSADESLAKVRGKKWSKPLGKTLGVTGKIVTTIGAAVPGVGILGSALSMGATLLNPEPTLKDLQKSMNEMKQELKSITETDEDLKAILEEGLREEIKEMEEKISTPMSEIRSDLKMIHGEMMGVKKVVQDGNDEMAKELSEIKDKIMQTFNIVVDEKYKVCSNFQILNTIITRGCQIGMQGPQLCSEPHHFCKLDMATSRMAFLFFKKIITR